MPLEWKDWNAQAHYRSPRTDYLPPTPMPRLAIAQIRPTKGDYAANLQRIGGVLAQLAQIEPRVDLLIFPETSTSGYFVEGGVRDVAGTAGGAVWGLSRLARGAQALPAGVAGGGCGGVPAPGL